MQLKYFSSTLLLITTSCGGPSYITGVKPFMNKHCTYRAVNDLFANVKILSKEFKYEYLVSKIDIKNNAFSVVIWKPKLNYILSGIFLHPNGVAFSAIKDGRVADEDVIEAEKIWRALGMKCQ